MTYTSASIRELEGASIRAFVESCSEHFTGRVLDLGCGKQPYRDVVEAAGGSWAGYDDPSFPGSVLKGDDYWAWPGLLRGDDPVKKRAGKAMHDTVLCTQVVQYVSDPASFFAYIRSGLDEGGALVLTFAMNWDWIEADDKWRFTPSGMASLLAEASFTVERSEERAAVELGGFRFPLGYGVVARAT